MDNNNQNQLLVYLQQLQQLQQMALIQKQFHDILGTMGNQFAPPAQSTPPFQMPQQPNVPQFDLQLQYLQQLAAFLPQQQPQQPVINPFMNPPMFNFLPNAASTPLPPQTTLSQMSQTASPPSLSTASTSPPTDQNSNELDKENVGNELAQETVDKDKEEESDNEENGLVIDEGNEEQKNESFGATATVSADSGIDLDFPPLNTTAPSMYSSNTNLLQLMLQQHEEKERQNELNTQANALAATNETLTPQDQGISHSAPLSLNNFLGQQIPLQGQDNASKSEKEDAVPQLTNPILNFNDLLLQQLFANHSAQTSSKRPNLITTTTEPMEEKKPPKYLEQETKKTHRKRKSDEEGRFICPICFKKFSRQWYVDGAHKRMHEGQKPFQCGKCEKPFNDKSNCRAHEKICDRKYQRKPKNQGATHDNSGNEQMSSSSDQEAMSPGNQETMSPGNECQGHGSMSEQEESPSKREKLMDQELEEPSVENVGDNVSEVKEFEEIKKENVIEDGEVVDSDGDNSGGQDKDLGNSTENQVLGNSTGNQGNENTEEQFLSKVMEAFKNYQPPKKESP